MEGRGPATRAGLEAPYPHPRCGTAHQTRGSLRSLRGGVPEGSARGHWGDTWALGIFGELWGLRLGALGICGPAGLRRITGGESGVPGPQGADRVLLGHLGESGYFSMFGEESGNWSYRGAVRDLQSYSQGVRRCPGILGLNSCPGISWVQFWVHGHTRDGRGSREMRGGVGDFQNYRGSGLGSPGS